MGGGRLQSHGLRGQVGGCQSHSLRNDKVGGVHSAASAKLC